MKEQHRVHEIDELVAGYLESQANVVDTKALIDRVTRSYRARRLRHRVGRISAIAAAVIVGIIGFLFTQTPQTHRPPVSSVPMVAQTIRQQAIQAKCGARTIFTGIDESMGSATDEILETVSVRGTPDLSSAVAETKATLEADARYVRTKAESIISGSLRKAGLLI